MNQLLKTTQLRDKGPRHTSRDEELQQLKYDRQKTRRTNREK